MRRLRRQNVVKKQAHRVARRKLRWRGRQGGTRSAGKVEQHGYLVMLVLLSRAGIGHGKHEVAPADERKGLDTFG